MITDSYLTIKGFNSPEAVRKFVILLSKLDLELDIQHYIDTEKSYPITDKTLYLTDK